MYVVNRLGYLFWGYLCVIGNEWCCIYGTNASKLIDIVDLLNVEKYIYKYVSFCFVIIDFFIISLLFFHFTSLWLILNTNIEDEL